jgi:peptidoglycan hydrolase CwlO-like protein
MRKLAIFILFSLAYLTPLYAQTEEALRKRINSLEASIEKEERELAKLKKGKASKQNLVNSLARQIEKRNALINARDKQIKQLNSDISKAQK